MARLLAGCQLVIERSDLDLLRAHLFNWYPAGRTEPASDITFLQQLAFRDAIEDQIFRSFANAYGLRRTFIGGCAHWQQVFNVAIHSPACQYHLANARRAHPNQRAECTVQLINSLCHMIEQQGHMNQCVAASKFAMFLWPDLPVIINDSSVRNTAKFINQEAGNQRINAEDYGTLWERYCFLYDGIPFITADHLPNLQVPDNDREVDWDEWLSRRLLDLALYRAVIVDAPVPPPDDPRIVFCPCALPDAARRAA